MVPRSRRSLLTMGLGISTAVAGCTSNQGDQLNGDSSSEESTMMTLSLVSQDDDPEPVAFEIDVFNDQLTETGVPTLDIAIENTGDQTVSWEHGGGNPGIVFPPRYIEPGGLRIGFEEEARMMDIDDGCARVESGLGREDAWWETELESGDTLAQRYAIVGVDNELDGVCPPPDTYRVEHEYDDLGEWGFEFQLE